VSNQLIEVERDKEKERGGMVRTKRDSFACIFFSDANVLFSLVRTARAIENQCYVIAAAQVGRHNEKRQSYGHSLGKQARFRSALCSLREESVDIMMAPFSFNFATYSSSLRSMG
jgi:hypothetical protein